MRVTGFGQVLFGLSVAGLGALGIAFHDFTLVWQDVPRSLLWHDALTGLAGAALLGGGAALLIPRTARPAALALAGVVLLFVLSVRMPGLVRHPLIEGEWYGVSETLTLVAGAWTIYSLLSRDGTALANVNNTRAGQIAFALALPAIGLSHFFYLDMTAPLIPSWLPFHVPLAWFTGAAHIAAGIAILIGISFAVPLKPLARVAAVLEATMMSLFTLLVWVPIVIGAPANRGDWVEICLSAAISGAAWAVAESFRGKAARTGY